MKLKILSAIAIAFLFSAEGVYAQANGGTVNKQHSAKQASDTDKDTSPKKNQVLEKPMAPQGSLTGYLEVPDIPGESESLPEIPKCDTISGRADNGCVAIKEEDVPRRTDHNSSRSNKTSHNDEVKPEGTDRATNYNSSRSNRGSK